MNGPTALRAYAATVVALMKWEPQPRTHNDQNARDWLCAACQIQNRAELDHNPTAAATFRRIRQRFLK